MKTAADWRGLKRAHREFPITDETACRKCGSRSNLQRHHRDRDRLNNRPSNIWILCQACHAALHMRARDWGRMGRKV